MTISIDENDEELKKVHQPHLPSPTWSDKIIGIDLDQEAVIKPLHQSPA